MDNHNRNGDFSEGVSEKEILQKLTSSQSNERLEALEDLSQLIKAIERNGLVFETAIISSVLKLCKSENSKEQLTALSVVEKLSDDKHCYQKLLKAGVIQILVDIISLEATQVKDQDIIQKRQQRALTSIKNFLENDEELYVEFIKVGLIPLLWNITLKQNQSSERKLSTQILELLSQNALVRDDVLKELNRFISLTSINHLTSTLLNCTKDYEERETTLSLLRNLDILKDLYKEGGKAFYDPSDFPWTKMLEDNWLTIRDEFNALQQRNLIAWPEKNLCKKGWDILGLYAFNNKFEENCALCPKTSELLEKIPGLTTALFSCLQPRTHIKPHIGYYQYSEKILRCHLGLIIPPDCALKVNGETMTWQEGKCMIFDDTFRHESWNKSNSLRVVLMLDFVYTGDPSVRNQEFLATAKLMKEHLSKQRDQNEKNDAFITKDLMEALKMFGKTSNVQEHKF